VEHRLEELIRQRVFGLALAYEDLNDHDELRTDRSGTGASPDTGYLGEVQACDTCRLVPDDDTAAELASSKGYVVTLRNDRWEVDARPL
jgi:hypothetical protein